MFFIKEIFAFTVSGDRYTTLCCDPHYIAGIDHCTTFYFANLSDVPYLMILVFHRSIVRCTFNSSVIFPYTFSDNFLLASKAPLNSKKNPSQQFIFINTTKLITLYSCMSLLNSKLHMLTAFVRWRKVVYNPETRQKQAVVLETMHAAFFFLSFFFFGESYAILLVNIHISYMECRS